MQIKINGVCSIVLPQYDCKLNNTLNIFSYVNVSTVDVDTSKLISERIKSTGALFLEVHSHFPLSNTKCCVIRIHITSLHVVILVKSIYPQAPVSGSKKPAEDGQLIFLTAGEGIQAPFHGRVGSTFR
ncbi:Glyoxylate/succinic semialdehyde reductase 2 [Arachis hypogaea]|nr:Glyoxylate/succinic semialdehyde reductase 2 [Arachis hypogaea]